MVTPGERIRELRKARRMSGADLGRALGFPEGQERQRVYKLETGQVELTAEMVVKLAEALHTPEQYILKGGTLSEGPAAVYQETQADDDTIPLFAYGDDGERRVVGMTARPPSLRGVRHAYAIYAPADCMPPRYAPGWLLYVNPNRPAATGRDVLVVRRSGAPQVRQLVRPPQGDKPAALQALTQRGATLLPASDIIALHLIVGSDQEG